MTTENLGATIANAVDAAVKSEASPGQDSTTQTPSDTSSAAAPASAASRPAPASASGTDAESSDPSNVSPTIRATEDDETLRDDAKWTQLEKRRTTLSNAREKATTAERERFHSELFGVPPGRVNLQQVAVHTRALVTDAVKYYNDLGDMLRQNGKLPPASAEGSEPAPARRAPVGQFQLPAPKLKTTSGVPLYGVEEVTQIIEDLNDRFEARLDERLQPHEKLATTLEQEREWLEARASADTDLAQAMKWPSFDKLGKRVAELMRDAVRRQDKSYTLRMAYNEAYVENDIVEGPTRDAELRKRIAAEQTEHQSDIAVPGASVVRQPAKKARNMDEVWDRAVKGSFAKHGG